MLKELKNKKGFSTYAAAAAMLATAAALIGFIIYGAMYNEYFDLVVFAGLILGLALLVFYLSSSSKIAELAPIAAIFCIAFAMGLFIVNAYPVIGDWYGNFNMYGSRGGLTPVIILGILDAVAALAAIAACFSCKAERTEAEA